MLSAGCNKPCNISVVGMAILEIVKVIQQVPTPCDMQCSMAVLDSRSHCDCDTDLLYCDTDLHY